jgi:photosystem II stability/assembly factor-like uncharacterized protein
MGQSALSITVWLLACLSLQAAWVPIGPFGGDARSLVADPFNPDRLFVGTRTGQVYSSADAGRRWTRLTGLEAPDNWVVDYLLIHPSQPQLLYAAMWSLSARDGGVFKSTDGGRTWAALPGIAGQSVRALAIAPSQPRTLVAGTLEGVFRSDDGGAQWQRISPAGHAEIRNVESVAIDPTDPDVIYAGTWHLPWKTTDGGANWVSIRKGMLDDSDVFSIAIDPGNPNRVYATACTGIYRSDSAGAEWRKIQGIPDSSRRTHTLVLDPRNADVLYAGTTEGLWRTPNGGRSWERLTPHSWIINSVVLDPREPSHFYLAMDHGGIMETLDAGATFRGASWGFSQRQVSRVIADRREPGRIYASLLHDGEFGGVYTTNSRGASWQQLGSGLDGRDVQALLLVTQPERRLLAGTPDGVFEYSTDQLQWQNRSRWVLNSKTTLPEPQQPFVRELYQSAPDSPIYAATSLGLFQSSEGRLWNRLPLDSGADGVYAVAASGHSRHDLFAAAPLGLALSRDGGQSWTEAALDGGRPLRIRRIAVHPTRPDSVFVATEMGLYRSWDAGRTWQKSGRGLPASAIRDVLLSASNPLQVLLAGAAGAFYSLDGGEWYTRLGLPLSADDLPAGFSSIEILSNQQVVASSYHNGLFLQDNRNSGLPRLVRPSR